MFDKFFDFLVSILGLFQFWTVLKAEDAGFIRRFGVPTRDMTPGLNLLWPFAIETSTHVDMRQWSDVLPAQSLRTKDGVDLVVRLMVAYRVEDPRKFVLNVFDATNNMQDLAAGALGGAVTKVRAAEVYSGAVLEKVRDRVTRAALKWGVEVVKVQMTDATPAPSFRLFGATKDEN